MKMKSFKQRVLREREQPNIYMQKTKGPKASMSTPNLDQRLKSKTVLNKENYQPNVQNRNQKPLAENTFGAAKMMIRQSVDDMKLYLNKQTKGQTSQKQLPHYTKQSQPKFDFLSKSNNYQRCATQRSLNPINPFAKKHLKTEECDDDKNTCPIIEDCGEFIHSEYESSENQEHEEKLNYAKCYQRPLTKNNHGKNIIIHQSLNYDEEKPRDMVTFGPSEVKNMKRYQLSREEEKKMKNDIVNNIIMNSKAEMMRSCDFEAFGGLNCINHNNKKAKYRLNAVLTEEQEQCFYCSKCAVNLAKQGFDIEEISALDRKMIMNRQPERDFLYNSMEIKSQKNHREEQLKIFQKRLQSLKGKISAKLQLFSQKSQQMTKIDKRIQLTISNYDHLIQILKEMRQQEIQKEEKIKKQKSLDINLKKHELSTILDNIKDTAFEINSQKNKLMALRTKQFTFMFDSYINKISSYEEYLTNLQNTQLAQQIATFDQNLASEQLDEETMINQIFDQMYKKLTNVKLQAMMNSSKPAQQVRKLQNPIKTHTELQSGGSSMFYCEQEEEEENRRPFRTLFESTQTEKSVAIINSQNMNHSTSFNESFNVNSSIQNPGHRGVKYFREQNYLPTFQQQQ